MAAGWKDIDQSDQIRSDQREREREIEEGETHCHLSGACSLGKEGPVLNSDVVDLGDRSVDDGGVGVIQKGKATVASRRVFDHVKLHDGAKATQNVAQLVLGERVRNTGHIDPVGRGRRRRTFVERWW